MSQTDPKHALGQAVGFAFKGPSVPLGQLVTMQTVLVITLNSTWHQYPSFRIPGGMQKANETLNQTFARELREETGVVVSQNPKDTIELGRTLKERGWPSTGEFPVALFAAFNCDFGRLLDPRWQERGSDGEEPQLVVFGKVLRPKHRWNIRSVPSQTAPLLSYHRKLLSILSRIDV